MNSENRWLLCCAALAAGEWCGFLAAPVCAMWLVFAIIAALTAAYGFGMSLKGWWLPFAFLFGIALALRVSEIRREFTRVHVDFNAGTPCDVALPVNSVPRVRPKPSGRGTASFASAVGDLRLSVIIPASGGAAESTPRIGELWRCVGWLSDPIDENPRRRVLWVRGDGTGARRVRKAWDERLREKAERVKAALSRRIGIGLDHNPEAAALNRAILLGERANLDGSLKDDFVAAGTIHVFAISGLHVMVVAQTLRMLLILFAVPVRVAGVVIIPLVWFYSYMIGMPPSALRATIMLTFLCLAPLGWRRPNGLVSWAAAFLLVHVASPESLMSVGCELSFVVMLALVLYSRWSGLGERSLREKIAVTCVAWAAGVPIVAAAFGRFTPAGILANLVAIPLASFAVATGVVGIVASGVSGLLAMHINNISALAVTAMANVSRLVASLPYTDFKIAPWSTAQCALWYAALVAAAYGERRWRQRIKVAI